MYLCDVGGVLECIGGAGGLLLCICVMKEGFWSGEEVLVETADRNYTILDYQAQPTGIVYSPAT